MKRQQLPPRLADYVGSDANEWASRQHPDRMVERLQRLADHYQSRAEVPDGVLDELAADDLQQMAGVCRRMAAEWRELARQGGHLPVVETGTDKPRRRRKVAG